MKNHASKNHDKFKISRVKSIRMLLLYNCGVIAGSMTALVVTPDTVLMGKNSSTTDCNLDNLNFRCFWWRFLSYHSRFGKSFSQF